MVAPNSMTSFVPGQAVRLLGCFLVWPARHKGRKPTTADGVYMNGLAQLTYAGPNEFVAGGAVVRTPDGREWYVPVSALADAESAAA